MKKSILEEIGRARLQQIMERAVKKAVAEQHAAGLPSVGLIDGVLSMRFADGRVVAVDSDKDRAITQGLEARAQRKRGDRPQEFSG